MTETAPFEGVDKDSYDFYRCYMCRRLLTRLEEDAALHGGSKRGETDMGMLIMCPCGSGKYSPTNLLWYEWFYPRVLKFAWLRIRGKA